MECERPVYSCTASVHFCWTTRLYVPEDAARTYLCDNLKANTVHNWFQRWALLFVFHLSIHLSPSLYLFICRALILFNLFSDCITIASEWRLRHEKSRSCYLYSSALSCHFFEGVRKRGTTCLHVCLAISACPSCYVCLFIYLLTYLLVFVCSSCLSMYPSIRDGVNELIPRSACIC
jgi:hypothetical protein